MIVSSGRKQKLKIVERIRRTKRSSNSINSLDLKKASTLKSWAMFAVCVKKTVRNILSIVFFWQKMNHRILKKAFFELTFCANVQWPIWHDFCTKLIYIWDLSMLQHRTTQSMQIRGSLLITNESLVLTIDEEREIVLHGSHVDITCLLNYPHDWCNREENPLKLPLCKLSWTTVKV